MKIYKSPCDVCQQVETCNKTCAVWRAWFSVTWEKLRTAFGKDN